MGRLTHRDENGKAAIWLYADPKRPEDVVREGLKKEKAVIERLAHYEDLEESGRLLELPEGFNEDKLFAILGTSGVCPNYQGLKRVANCSSTTCWGCWEAALKGECHED